MGGQNSSPNTTYTHTLLSIALVFSFLSTEYIETTVYRRTVAYVVIIKSVESGQVYTALGDTVSLRLWPYPFSREGHPPDHTPFHLFFFYLISAIIVLIVTLLNQLVFLN